MLKNIIKKSPKIVNKTICNIYYNIPDYIKYGRKFRKQYNFLEESQYWSKEKLEKYQLNELKKLIKHAYETVPYYKKLFDKNNIRYEQINSFEDLKKIPYLTKDIIKENLEELISNKYNKNDIKYVTTGGSTGVPMGFYIDDRSDFLREWSFIANIWNRVGYNPKKNNRMVILRGNFIENGFYEYKDNKLILSSFKIEKHIEKYIELIRDYNPDFIQAYPSSIIILARYINLKKINLKLNNLKAIICSSENIYSQQRNEIEDAFNTRVFSFYGHTEHSCIAGECEQNTFYHLNSEYGYTELLDEQGKEIIEDGNLGELVVTGFGNYVMPFIRYKTGDMAILSKEKCDCGRNYKMIKKIQGRKQDYFINKNGEKIIFTWADYPLWSIKDKIWAYQYVQNEPGKVFLYIHFKEEVKPFEFKNIFDEVEKIFNKYYDDFEIEIRLNNEIKRTSRGKFKYLIQNINLN